MCDDAIWQKMSETAEEYDGIQPDEAGLPLDWIVEDVLQDTEILQLVGPRIRPAGGNRPSAKAKNGPKPKGKSAEAKKTARSNKKAAQKARNADAAAFRQQNGQAPGGKGRGKNGAGATAVATVPPTPKC